MAKAVVTGYKVQYAIRFDCIYVPSDYTFPYVGDNTTTEVSIHNFNNTSVKFRKKLADPDAISPFIVSALKPDAVDRTEFANLSEFDFPFPETGYFDGFLVIESQRHLDVYVTYLTVGGKKRMKIEGREGSWS
ncbi:MAG: hypothetical protein IT245_04835 [Bacteroidia bacterium]|nr:hypothetical protein [Bacteroidia bacterium]